MLSLAFSIEQSSQVTQSQHPYMPQGVSVLPTTCLSPFCAAASSMLGSLGSGTLRLGSGPLSPTGRSFHHFLPDMASLGTAPDCSRRHELSTWDLDCTALDKEELVRHTQHNCNWTIADTILQQQPCLFSRSRVAVQQAYCMLLGGSQPRSINIEFHGHTVDLPHASCKARVGCCGETGVRSQQAYASLMYLSPPEHDGPHVGIPQMVRWHRVP
jgi:hypothetical protein